MQKSKDIGAQPWFEEIKKAKEKVNKRKKEEVGRLTPLAKKAKILAEEFGGRFYVEKNPRKERFFIFGRKKFIYEIPEERIRIESDYTYKRNIYKIKTEDDDYFYKIYDKRSDIKLPRTISTSYTHLGIKIFQGDKLIFEEKKERKKLFTLLCELLEGCYEVTTHIPGKWEEIIKECYHKEIQDKKDPKERRYSYKGYC